MDVPYAVFIIMGNDGMTNYTASTSIITIDHVTKQFAKSLDLAGKIAQRLGAKVHDEIVLAVDDANMSIGKNEVVGLVGESGCGKSTLGRMVAGILNPTKGRILYQGKDIRSFEGIEARKMALKVQMIFQDPFASLNPRMRMRDLIGEAPVFHGIVSKSEMDKYVDSILMQCGLDTEYKLRYPHQFSGGQRQRIGIARALAVNPEFIVCDEAFAALDVSIQAQIINLFMKLREDLDLTYLFISHDIGMVEHVSDRVVIMYLGKIVEIGKTDELFAYPNHPYTKILLMGAPRLENRHHQFLPIEGEIPSPLDPPSGCYFHPRCPNTMPRCKEEKPALKEIAPGRLSACHLNEC